MLKPVLIAIVLVLSSSLANAADETTGGPNDACMKQAYDLADQAEAKQLPEKTLEALDGMFNDMEKHCKALELPQARATAEKIKATIDAGK